MEIIVCLDDSNGMMFGGRRQSRDRVVTQDIGRLTAGRLVIMPYSVTLFEKTDIEYSVCDNDTAEYAPDSVLFVENVPVSEIFSANNIDKVIIYKWNRKYPGDVFFDVDLAEKGYKLTETVDLAGFSHEKITREIYEK